MLPEGSIVADRYEIEARIGDGSMGVVYRARHVKFGRRFAIKVLHHSLTDNEKVLRRFEREAELAGRLRHTNVAAVVDVGVTPDGSHFSAMELAAGVNLYALLDEDGPLSEVRVLDLAKQLCSGLQHAHDLGLIHRDFKPENVIVEQLPGGREVARIVDWGVAVLRDYAGDVDADGRLTTKGIVIGTPHYMAPEQALGVAIDHRIDIFALGLMCYELLTGTLPFDGSGVDVARANMSAPIPRMAERAPDRHVDVVLEAIVRRLLEKDRDDRPASGNAARELFELYERDRAGCARLLGVALPVEHVEPVVEAAAESEDPERSRATLEVHAASRRRITAVAIVFGAALALVLYLGLRGHAPSSVPDLAAIDAGEPITLAVSPLPVAEISVPAPPPPVVPLPPVKKAPLPRIPAGSASPTKTPAVAAPTAAEVATLYGALGRELKTLEDAKGMGTTMDLWPRYRWIRINEWITTPERRAHVAELLERLRADIVASR